MRPIVTIAGLALAIGLAPATSDAACARRTTGTVVGAVTGGLLGSAVAGHGARTEGTLLGAAAGGLIGNQITKCRYARRAYYPRRAYSRSAYAPRAYGQPAYAQSGYSQGYGRGVCRYETRGYYDASGRMVYSPTQVCE